MKIVLKKSLEKEKAEAKEEIDRQIGEIRKLYITVVPGQDLVYQEKRIEAERLIADPNLDPSEAPHIYLEASLNEVDPLTQANMILQAAAAWREISAPLEEIRLSAKKKVDQAETKEEIEEAKILVWPPVD